MRWVLLVVLIAVLVWVGRLVWQSYGFVGL
jgi:hypothetical protein